MIVESTQLLSSRAEPSGSTGSDRRPDRAGDGAFGRALTDVLTADRTERPAPHERRPRPEPVEDRPSRATDRKRSRIDDEDDNDRTPERDEAKDPVDRPTTATDRAAERVSTHLEETNGRAQGLEGALSRLDGEIAAEATAEETAELDGSVETDLTLTEIDQIPTSEEVTDDTVVSGEDEGEGEGDLLTSTTTKPTQDTELVDDARSAIETEPTPVTDRQPGGRTIAEIARGHRGAGLGQVVAEMLDSTGDEPGTESQASANASPVAAVASGRAGPANETAPTEETAPEESPSDGQEADPSGGEPSPLGADDTAVTGAESGETADSPLVATPDHQPDKPLGPGTSRGVDNTPSPAPAASAQRPGPAPELVELHTTGLAERLRPAFAAVRRGVNGLDELRLRIQDDNGGPIKVDITTVDNRVRVLLSARNEDLMSQLGQERERLAEELRRAGFEQASIDIDAGGKGERHELYGDDGPVSSRNRSGGNGHGRTAVGDDVAPIPARRGRAATGLDLDL